MERAKPFSLHFSFHNVHFSFEDNSRNRSDDSFDEEDEDLDISSDRNDPPYCPNDETESDASSCESKISGKLDSFNGSLPKEAIFLVFWLRLLFEHEKLEMERKWLKSNSPAFIAVISIVEIKKKTGGFEISK